MRRASSAQRAATSSRSRSHGGERVDREVAPGDARDAEHLGVLRRQPVELVRLVAAARALCGNHADADDLVQEVYLTLLRRPRRLKAGSEIAYLMTMLRNAQIDRYRATARRQTFPLDEGMELEDPRSGLWPDRALEHREVLDAVHALASPFRETVVAVDVLGLSYKEAGQALGTPVGTVMSRLARGRERVIGTHTPVQEVVHG